MTPEQEIYRAQRAKYLLDNEVFVDAFDQIKAEISEQWKSSPARDVEGREKLWLMLRMLERVQACLTATMDGGKLARAELAHKKTLTERARDLLN